MLDPNDRRLIRALKKDSRASISKLAADLGMARATVRNRVDRLISSGVIQRFTIELSSDEGTETVRAIVLIRLEGSMSRPVIRALSVLPHIDRLHATNGAWDLIAEVHCTTLRDFDHALRAIREVPGVTNSESCLLLDQVG